MTAERYIAAARRAEAGASRGHRLAHRPKTLEERTVKTAATELIRLTPQELSVTIDALRQVDFDDDAVYPHRLARHAVADKLRSRLAILAQRVRIGDPFEESHQ